MAIPRKKIRVGDKHFESYQDAIDALGRISKEYDKTMAQAFNDLIFNTNGVKELKDNYKKKKE